MLGVQMKSLMFAAILALAGNSASAEVVDQKTADKMLFSTKGHSVQVSGKISSKDQKIVTALIPLMGKQLRQPVRYYAAIAYSPGDGWVHDSLQAALNYHTIAAASAAARKACNKLRSRGKPKCIVAAVVVPKKYKKRDLTLSVDATASFKKSFKKSKSPKVFAISRASGAYAVGASENNALQACNKAAKGARDCEIVIKD